ncbi:MAG TPA: T9SS type A sorting domain-containing protein [Ignavibacteria bacterium]
MKNTVRFFLVFILSAFLISINVKIYSQTPWSQPFRLTNGFVDKNPAFGFENHWSGMGIYLWEFLVFERHSNPYSQICVKKIDLNPSDSVRYLTSNSSLKRNPAIAYDNSSSFQTLITNSLVLWESNENGKWDIFGCYYNSSSGWGTPFPFDTTAGNKYKPHLINMTGNMFAIAYEKNGDIIFRQFNAQTRTVTYDTNLTFMDTSYCSNPALVTYSTQYYVTYEKRKPDNKNAVYFRKGTLPTWTLPDTIAFWGNNSNDGFCGSQIGYIVSLFESDRTGNTNIFATSVNPYSGALQQEVVINNPGYSNKNFVSIYIPIITDYIPYQAAGYVRRGNDSIKIKLLGNNGSSSYSDSVTVGDTSKQVSISMNLGIFSNWLCAVYVVYNKDSASYSQLWAKRRLIVITGIRRLGTSVPDRYSLSQNYPNPFNPVTKIKFDIKKEFRIQESEVKLSIYDILGRKIKDLVSEKLQPGSYEVTFDGNNLGSGVYFYQLRAGDFTATKKLILLK